MTVLPGFLFDGVYNETRMRVCHEYTVPMSRDHPLMYRGVLLHSRAEHPYRFTIIPVLRLIVWTKAAPPKEKHCFVVLRRAYGMEGGPWSTSS